MNDEDKEKLINKYKEIAENQSLPPVERWENIFFPVVIKVAAKTISQDLFFASQEEIEKVKNKVKIENRNDRIDSVIEGKEYIEKKLEEDEEYKKLMRKKGVTPMSSPSGILTYFDYTYDSCTENKDDSKKKKKSKKK